MAHNDDYFWKLAALLVATACSIWFIFWISSVVLALLHEVGYWVVALGALIGAGVGLTLPSLLKYLKQKPEKDLEAMVSLYQSRHKGKPIQIDGQFGIFLSANLRSKSLTVLVSITWTAFAESNVFLTKQKEVAIPSRRRYFKSEADLYSFLHSKGLRPLDSESVEYKALDLAIECHKEIKWITDALSTISRLGGEMEKTLEQARSNRLLESSIPKLEIALSDYASEGERLSRALSSTLHMLDNVTGFLSIPEQARMILGLDIDREKHKREFSALEESFEEVASITEALGRLTF
jgi:hypothetical protein